MSVARQQVTFTLLFNDQRDTNADLTNPSNFQVLNNASIFRDSVVFVNPKESVASVSYHLDGLDLGTFSSGQGVAPVLGPAALVDTPGTDQGSHSIVATVTSTDGEAHTLGAVFEVVLPPVASVEIVMEPLYDYLYEGVPATEFPSAGSLPSGSTRTLYALVTDVEGNLVEDRAVEWSTANDGIASLSSINAGEDDGYTFYGRYFGEEDADSVDIDLGQGIQVTGHSTGTVAITATADGVSQSVAIDVHLPYQSVSTNGRHTCAVSFEGDGYCWGNNFDGQLGNFNDSDSTLVSVNAPTMVALGAGWSWLYANTASSDSVFHSCGAYPDGSIQCWGNGAFGQLGDGKAETNGIPTTVLVPDES